MFGDFDKKLNNDQVSFGAIVRLFGLLKVYFI